MYAFEYSTGPIDTDQYGGDVKNVHLDALNRSGSTVFVTLKVFKLGNYRTLIDSETKKLRPDEHEWYSIDTEGADHIEAVICFEAASPNSVLLTVYGRNRDFVDLPGATYRHSELVLLD